MPYLLTLENNQDTTEIDSNIHANQRQIQLNSDDVMFGY